MLRLPAGFAPAAAAVEPAAVEPAGALRLRPGLVDRQGATAQGILIELRGRLLRFFVCRHLDEREAARTAGCHVAHDTDRFNRSRLAEQFLQLRLSNLVRQVPDVQLPTHVSRSLSS